MNNKTTSLFEFDFLISDRVLDDNQPHATNVKPISESAFQHLKQLYLLGGKDSRLFKLRSINQREALQVQNYAGVIFTPDKTQIEVLPKFGRQGEDSEANKKTARQSLLMMLKTLKGFRHIETQYADIASQKMPLLEVFIGQFLQSVNRLVKRGLRSDYIAQEDNLAFLKGKLNIGKQIRHNFINKHKFYVEYDEFLQDRPANRLLHSALVKVNNYTRSARNKKLLQELLFIFADIPKSRDYKLDFVRLKIDRGMNYYHTALEWTRLVLEGFSPQSMQGSNNAPSLLFPMEAVFESYVASLLRGQVAEDFKVKEQVRSEKLVTHDKQQWFLLKPDLIIEQKGKAQVVLDTKWKVLDKRKNNGKEKYGLSQADFYQMFAYGQRYLAGKGDLFLLYPQSEFFTEAIPFPFCFHYEEEVETKPLNLWVVPVDLSDGVIVEKRIKWPTGFDNRYLKSLC